MILCLNLYLFFVAQCSRICQKIGGLKLSKMNNFLDFLKDGINKKPGLQKMHLLNLA